ncbi:MAG TPA: hypothetical protein VF686_06245 [Brevundimonas sp.]
MLKLEATLVATMAARSRRSGWSPDGGVDFVLWAPKPQASIVAPVEARRTVADEPASFLDADEILTPGVAVVRRYVSLAAQVAEVAAREPVERPLTRAWSSVARKVPGS